MREIVALRHKRIARAMREAGGLKPIAYPLSHGGGWAVFARAPWGGTAGADNWRVYIFDAQLTPVGDYAPRRFGPTSNIHRGLIETALEFGAELEKPCNPLTIEPTRESANV